MKAKRLLFFVMAICLACKVKAQFYDGPDDIYYYVQAVDYDNKNSSTEVNDRPAVSVMVFNFDGKKATQFEGTYSRDGIIKLLQENPNYFEDKVETADYTKLLFITSKGSKTIYEYYFLSSIKMHAYFSSDRKILITHVVDSAGHPEGNGNKYIRVDKSFFKRGRSRTPSESLYE